MTFSLCWILFIIQSWKILCLLEENLQYFASWSDFVISLLACMWLRTTQNIFFHWVFKFFTIKATFRCIVLMRLSQPHKINIGDGGICWCACRSPRTCRGTRGAVYGLLVHHSGNNICGSLPVWWSVIESIVSTVTLTPSPPSQEVPLPVFLWQMIRETNT